MRLKDKIAIVTGAGSGFGRGIALRFAAEGARVVVNDLNAENGEHTVENITEAGGEARFIAGDVSRDADVKRLVEFTLATFGGLDIVVNNAGTTHKNQPMLDVSEAEFDRIYQVNVKSLYLTAKHAVPHMRGKHGGAFITIASTAGVRPRPGLTWYNGSKGAAIVRHIALDGRGTREGQHPRQRHQSCRGRDRDARGLHGAGHAGAACAVRRVDPARPAVATVRHRDGGGVLRVRRGRIRHGCVPRGRRRPLRLTRARRAPR